MPPPVADQSKVQKRKTEMGHGSFHGNGMEGYGKSPVTTKPKLPGAVDLGDLDYTLSPGRVGSKRRSANTRHPHSAPTRSKKLSAGPNGFPTVPDLFGNNDTTGGNTRAKSARNFGTSPVPERSARKFQNSTPLGLVLAPDLDMDSSQDSDSFNPPSRIEILTRSSSAGHEPESFPLSSISTSNFLHCIPEKKIKRNAKTKNAKELVTKDTSLATSSSSDKNGSPPEKARRSASASPGRNKQKYGKRASAPVTSAQVTRDTDPTRSPTRLRHSTSAVTAATGKKTMVVKPSRSVSMPVASQPINSNSNRGKSPDKRSSNYHRGNSDLTHNRLSKIHSPEREGLVLSSSHSRSEDAVAKRSTKPIKAMQAPMTWQNDRDSRKLNSSNLKEKLGRIGPMPVLDDPTPRLSQSPRRSQRQSAGLGLSASYQNNVGLDSSLRSSGHGSSHKRSLSQPRTSGPDKRVSDIRNMERDKRLSQSSHLSRSMGPRNSAHQRMSQSAHARSSLATTSKDAFDSPNNARRSMQTSAHKAGGVVGSVVTLVDKVLENTTQLPSNKYGISEREKAAMAVDDESVGGSFAAEDIEARGDPNSKQNDPKKPSPEGATFHVPKIMEMTLGIEKRPPLTLVVVWMLIVTELTFDFVTTVISFKAFTSAIPCCGYEMNLGILPMAVTVPFFCLVMAESLFLFIGITVTLWPSIVNVNLEGHASKSWLLRPFLCCFKWNASAVLYALNITVILNPFFGCVIAWMLMYQSNKTQSFLVLGLEGASILLHFTSVWLEGHFKSCKTFCFHSVQLIPFLASVILILLYLRQGGICYIVSEEKFAFTGCEVCPNGYPPIGGYCQLADGTNITYNTLKIWEVQGDFNDLANALTARSKQASYCAGDQPNGPDENFCFFKY